VQISGWYNVFLRDEILAEWRGDGLHVHCHVSAAETWWLAPGRLRNFIFCREMPLVLDCLRYAERAYFSDHPQLPTSATNIHFHAQVRLSPRAVTQQRTTAGLGDDFPCAVAPTRPPKRETFRSVGIQYPSLCAAGTPPVYS